MMRRNKDIERRSRQVRGGKRGTGPVVYWMSRDQRVHDNYGLLFAQQEAIDRGTALQVVFCLIGDYPGATLRHYLFMLKGLVEVQRDCARYGIGFTLLTGDPIHMLHSYLRNQDANCLVCDFDPLRIKRKWQNALADGVSLPIYEVDAHNVVPVWVCSNKKEYAAYTIRPKINRLRGDYLVDIPELVSHPYRLEPAAPIDVGSLSSHVADKKGTELGWLDPGQAAAHRAMEDAIAHRLPNYEELRNDPTRKAQSNLSPYLHFGHLAPQRLAYRVLKADLSDETREAFLEELIVRRELSDNFCYYEPNYDTSEGFAPWARQSLEEHRGDRREYIYSLEEFDQARTHEPLWNGCQMDLVQSGKLHGYLRMYWAKKILEWSASPEEAQAYAIALNDRYSLDGRDPNGYTGIAWSIGGVHDRAWPERKVFGKIRYMNEKGCRRKFKVDEYIKTVMQQSDER
jgi:deoxyribodipyrimidine photo-lyase